VEASVVSVEDPVEVSVVVPPVLGVASTLTTTVSMPIEKSTPVVWVVASVVVASVDTSVVTAVDGLASTLTTTVSIPMESSGASVAVVEAAEVSVLDLASVLVSFSAVLLSSSSSLSSSLGSSGV
jgi:hypothetical protein